jgi:hypothetical protein
MIDQLIALLRALGEGRIPGVPWSLRILLLGQSSLLVDNGIASDTAKTHPKEHTVLEHVVHSDARQELAIKEAESAFLICDDFDLVIASSLFSLPGLSNALDNVNDVLAVVRTVRKLKHERLLRKLAEMKEIASRRSGARGNKARKELILLETQVAASASL